MKNMKLTNLSLSVLIALGLVACGGSDDKGNAPEDKNPPPGDTSGGNGGNGGDAGNKGPKKDPKDGLEVAPRDPRRAAPGLTVEPNHADVTAINKQLFIDRQSRNSVAGYNGWADPNGNIGINVQVNGTRAIQNNNWLAKGLDNGDNAPQDGDGINAGHSPVTVQGGLAYNKGATDKKDILRASSIYNYFEHQSQENSLNENGGIHANPSYSYALGDDGFYYRVKPAGNAKWDDLDATSKFEIISDALGDSNNYGTKNSKGKKIPMSEIVFIPNALTLDTDTKNGTKSNEVHLTDPSEFKNPTKIVINTATAGINVVNPDNIGYFDVTRGDVAFKSFEIVGAGKKYDLVEDFNTQNIPLDLSKVTPKYEIQKFPIRLDYTITNNQATGTLNDDEVVKRTAKVGELKLYDLPYSRSSITVNQQAAEKASHPQAAPNNLFGLAGGGSDYGNGHYGAFQVVGFQTNSLPRDGRADYVGKSYGVDSEGDIHLVADFAINRAGIHGGVNNRVSSDGRKLADLKLGQINLTHQGADYTASKGMQKTSPVPNGDVSVGGRSNAGKWAVALYGPNAEEAAGVIDFVPAGSVTNGVTSVADGKKFEVFSTQRKELIDDSLNPGVGSAKK